MRKVRCCELKTGVANLHLLQNPRAYIGKQTQFNVVKCHSMRLTRHYSHKRILHDCTLHQQTLENFQSVKYIGITITENFDWGQHISDISSNIVSEYDQEIPQSQTADNPVAPRGRAAQPSRDTR